MGSKVESRVRLLAGGKGSGGQAGGDPRLLAVTSGTNGVGKSSIILNLGLALRQLGREVLIVDAAGGQEQAGQLAGLAPRVTLEEILAGCCRLAEAVVTGPQGLKLLPGPPAGLATAGLDQHRKLLLLEELNEFAAAFDYVLFDAGTGVSSEVLYFNLGVRERVIVVDQEADSLIGAYTLIKFLAGRQAGKRFKILFNRITQPQWVDYAFAQLAKITDRFLHGAVFLDLLGWLPWDGGMIQAQAHRQPLLELFPSSPVGLALLDLARELDLDQPEEVDSGNIRFFHPRLRCRIAG